MQLAQPCKPGMYTCNIVCINSFLGKFDYNNIARPRTEALYPFAILGHTKCHKLQVYHLSTRLRNKRKVELSERKLCKRKSLTGSTVSTFLKKTVHISIDIRQLLFMMYGNAVLVVLCNSNMYRVNPGGQKAQG